MTCHIGHNFSSIFFFYFFFVIEKKGHLANLNLYNKAFRCSRTPRHASARDKHQTMTWLDSDCCTFTVFEHEHLVSRGLFCVVYYYCC